MNRRNLLNAFGIGSIVVPVIGGTVDRSAAAQIIEPPKVKPVELYSSIPRAIDAKSVKRLTLTLECDDGTQHQIDANVIDWFSTGFIRPDVSVILKFIENGVSPASINAELYAQSTW